MKRILLYIASSIMGFIATAQNTNSSFVQPIGTTFGNQTVIRMLYAPTPAYGYGQALVYLPPGYNLPANATRYYPCLFFSPGSGETDEQNIIEVLNTSIPQLIAQGFNPYAIDTITHDTIPFIVISQHATGGAAFAYPQLQYTLPYLLADTIFRIDTTCFFFAGLSNGGRATASMVVGNVAGDTVGLRATGGIVISAAGYDNFQNSNNFVNAHYLLQHGYKPMAIIGGQDQNYNALGYFQFDTMYKNWSVPPGFNLAYRHCVFPNAGHTSAVWNTCFQLNFHGLDSAQNKWNLWDYMWAMRKNAPQGATTANAGPNQTITLPTSSATLSGLGTPRQGTNIDSYLWTKVSGPGLTTINNANQATATATGLQQGTYVFNLRVTDNGGGFANATTQVTVNPVPVNQPPISNAGSDQVITLPTNSVTMAGSASDPDGTISTKTWSQVSGPNTGTITTPSSYTTTITGLIQGTYVFRLTVVDNSSAQATDDMQVVVNPSAGPPALYVTNLGVTEYKIGYLMSDSSVRGYVYNQATGKVELMSFIMNSRKGISIGAGFNQLGVTDDQNYFWYTYTPAGQTANLMLRIDTDTTGAAFNICNRILGGYFYSYILSSIDSSQLWYVNAGVAGQSSDSYNFYHLGGTGRVMTKPVKLKTPPGKKILKAALGNDMLILMTDGTVYRYNNGDTNYVQIVFPRKVIDCGISKYNWAVFLVADPAPRGQNVGFPFVLGSEFGFWGGVANANTPIDVRALWGTTIPYKSVSMNQNTAIMIDSLNDMYGIGDNPNGEVGNGQELVNRFTYQWQYAWSWNKGEFYTGAPVQKIGSNMSMVFSSNTYAFYHYALDLLHRLYVWGRDKSFTGGKGLVNTNEVSSPNWGDVLSPTIIDPVANTPGKSVNFIKGICSAGSDQTVSTSVISLAGTATAAQAQPWGYSVVSWQWNKLNGAACTIVSPTAATTQVTGLTTGVYTFQLIVTDNNSGTIADTVQITVGSTVFTPPTVTVGGGGTIQLPTNFVHATGTASPNGGGVTITSQAWSQQSGPASATFQNQTSLNTDILNMNAPGTYIFALTVTDSNNQSTTKQITVSVLSASSNILTFPFPTIIVGP